MDRAKCNYYGNNKLSQRKKQTKRFTRYPPRHLIIFVLQRDFFISVHYMARLLRPQCPNNSSGTDRISGQLRVSESGSLSGGSIILLSLSGSGVLGYPGVGYFSKNCNIRQISGSGFGSLK